MQNGREISTSHDSATEKNDSACEMNKLFESSLELDNGNDVAEGLEQATQ